MKRILFNLLNSRKKLLLLWVILFVSGSAFSQTRFYLNLNTTAAISPAYHTTWNVTSGAARYEMNTDRDGSAITSKNTGNSGGSATRRCLLDQWVSEPLDAQTITGTFTGQIRFSQNNATAPNVGQGIVYLRVINANGTIATVVNSASTSNLTTTLTNRTLVSFNVGTLNITAGQRLAIDVGWTYSGGTNNAVNCTISRGSSSGTDLPANNTTTTANTPWVQFSDDIIFLPPANDDCVGAVSLTPGASCVNTAGTLKHATPDAGTPTGCFAAGAYYDVWYSFVATTYTHTISLSGLGTNFTAPRIQVYRGSCGTPISMGSCVSGTTLVQPDLVPGTTYFVRVANYNADPSGLGTVANFNICITNNPPPANDQCAGSVLLTSALACNNTTGNLQYAASNGPVGACGGATATTTYGIWYRFVANSTTHSVTLSGLGSNLAAATTYIETFSSTGTCAGLISLGCQNASTPEVIGGLTVGATYYVRVFVTTAPTNTTTANWNFSICIQQPPANDECAGSVLLTSGASCVNTAGTLHVATPSTGIPIACFAAGTYYDVWYRFVATTFTHTVTLSSLGANITSPQIQIYSGTCGALVSEGCASGTTLTEANLTPGATYYIRVANYNADPTGVAGFNICVTGNPPATNDICTTSTLLTSANACSNTTGNLQYAASNGPAGACGSATATTTYDVWYRFVANSTIHTVTLSGLGSNLTAATTYIETFSSTGACAGLTSIACQNASTREVLTGLTIGNTYYVRIYVTAAPNNATTANWNFSICIQQPPANDECANAVNLTPGASCVNTGGSLNVAQPNVATPTGCFAPGTYYDVWYSFTATTFTHTVTLSALGANITSPQIQLYSGTCGALVSENCVSGTTLTEANLTPGNTYYIRVANYNADPTGTAGFNICVVSNPPPANDQCGTSTLLTSGAACVNTTGNLQYAASNGPAGACGSATATTTYDIWYRFVANSTTHYVTLSSLGSNLAAATTYIETFSGACGSLTSIACQNATAMEILSGLTIGSTYYVRIYVTSPPNNATTANWNFSICIQQPPANDECAGAINLTPGSSCSNTAGTMNLSTENVSTPLSCFAPGTYYDVWYRFTAVTTIQTITLTTLGANFSAPRIQIYSGTCGALVSEGCVTGTSFLKYGLTVGATYYVRIANYNVNALTAATFNICITYITPPANDECTGAVALTSGTSCSNTSGTLLNSSPDSDGLPACGNAGSAEVWYRFIANSNRPVITLSGLGSNFTAAGSYMQLFSGLCGSLTSIACVSGLSINTAVTPGGVGLTINSTYYIRVTTNTSTSVPTSGNWGFSICITDPVGAAVDFAKTYVNITDGTAGGTIDPGDVLEIRSILVVQRPGSSTANVAIDSIAFYDTLTANKGYRLMRDSMALKTNEGKLFRPTNSTYFTDSGADGDAAWTTTAGAGSDTALQINMGLNSTRTRRGKLGHTSRPSNFGSTCIIMATYRVRVTAAYGTKIMYGGGAFRYRDSTTGVFYVVNFPKDSLIVYASPGACPDAASATNVVGDEDGGTFGAPTGSPVFPQNRGTSANTNYAYATFGGGNGPGDYYYGVANNTSGNGTTVQTVIKPTATTRVFSVWDITGDHTGATNTGTTSKGNLPCNLSLPISATNPCGYMLVVNSAYRADVAFEYNFSGACTETYYEISAWMKNICSKCGCDSLGTGSTNAGYQPTAPGDSSGIRPNVAFQINGIDYYTTGDIVHQGVGSGIASTRSDTLNRWVKRSFVYKTKPGETSFNMTFRNNAPGGGGNDWAIDDISIRTCYPNMSYSPSVNPNACANNTITITDTVRSYYNTYTEYKWQRSTDGGTTWVDIAGTTATATPIVVNGMYQFVTAYTIPAAFTTLANSGDQYRVVVATNATNLATNSCSFSDVIPITITVTTPSIAPTSITGADICSSGSTTLTALGGTLGTSANYQWGTGSVVGTNPIIGATGSTLTVSPTSTTTYWVRIENTTSPCPAITGGLTRTITVSQPSVAPSSITGGNICSGSSTTLTALGATLGTNANYQWGTGSVVGTSPIVGATGSTLIVSPTSTTTYWVRIENTTAPCTANTAGLTRTITVTQASIAPSSITGADICNPGSTTLTAVGATLGTSANYQWGTGAVVGTSPIVGATAATLTVSPTSTTTYWVRIENTASPCTALTGGLTRTITVNQPSVAPSSITGANICNGSSTTLTAVGATLGTSANYQWGTGGVVGTSPIVGATGSTLTVSPTTTTTYWVRVENTGSPCTAITGGLTRTITVSQPSVAPSSITGADICNGSSTTLTAVGATLGTSANYQWGTGAVVGTSPIVGATGSTLTVSPTTTTTYWVRVENTGSPCTAITGGLTRTITVSQPSVAPSSITGADICNGSSTTLTAVGATLGTSANYQWGTGAVVGTSPIVGATGSTLTVSPTTTTTYWVRVENTGSPCTAITGGLTRTITVNQPSVAPSSITGADICNGGSTTLTAVGATLGTSANYQWGTGAVVGTSPIVGATGSTLTVSPTTTTTYWVRVENTGSPCTAITGGLTRTITVSQPSVAPSSITGADICNGSSTTLTAVGATLGTSANYQWGTGGVVGTSPIVGATGSTLTVSPTTTTTYWVRIENTSSPCTALTGGLTRTITVSQPSVAPSSITGADICNGSSTTLTAIGATLGTSANYQWGTGAVVGTSPIVGAIGSTLTVSPTTTTTYWVRVENTSSPCTALTGGLTRTITVSQPSVAPSSITGADICNGSSTTLTAVGATLGTSANYQWGTGAVVGTSPIVGATGSTLTVSPTTTTTYWVRVENTASPCTALTGGLTRTITVSQPSVAPSSITGANICNGSSTTLTAVGATLGTSANYQWGTGAVVGTSPIVGATGSTLTVSPTTTTTYWVRIENTSSPCTALTGGLTRTITVTQPSVAPSSITGANICNGSSTTLTAVGATLGTSANYQWGTGGVVGTSPIVGATGSTLTVSPTTTTTYWVRIENTASPCTAITGGLTRTITVNQPSVAPSSLTGADICNGSSTTLTAVGATLGTSANYQWGIGGVVGTSPIVGATGSTLTVSPTSTTTYWVRVENTAGPCTANTGGLTRTITVTQPSIAPASITGLNVCSGGSTTLTATGGTLGTGANYQWGTGAVVGTSPIAGATNATLTVSPGTATTYWVRIQNTASPCTPTTGGVTRLVTVNLPSVAPASVTGLDICNGSSTTLTAIGATLGTSANYQWGTGAVVGTNPIVGATSSTLTVSPTSTTTYWVRVENSAAPCTVNTGGVTRTITVNQPSVAATAAGKNRNNICPGISVKIYRTGGTTGTGANWRWYTGSPGGTLMGSGDTLTVTPLVTTTYYIRAEGLCNTTPAEAVTIFISCDIDKDKDGIPDYMESNIAAATANGYNTGYAGYVDNNSDFINDNFQADGDSDNDGIPNYLDATFAGRVDLSGPLEYQMALMTGLMQTLTE